ncbi:MAG: XrtA/PEP-CTERM system exopolysaccharide export protein [Betaproteobacteria bacterium]
MNRKMMFILLVLLLAKPVFAAEYIIGEGDTLTISVWGEKDLSLSVKVRPDGKITLPAIGEVAAANMTPARLQTVLTNKLKGIVKNPIVTVIVTEITNNKVYIFGGGVSSGVYSLAQRTTLLQLLCQLGHQVSPSAGATGAGTASPDLKNAYVLRKEEKIKKDFYNLFIKGQTSEDIVIEPNDAIFIPAYVDKNVYIMGAVAAPKAIEYRESLTVMEAILGAGGFTKFASPNDTIIYRKENNREMTIKVKAKRLMSDGDLTQNVMLKPGDYIVVHEGIF